MQARTVGLDLAKNTFQIHAVDDDGLVVARRALRRIWLLTLRRRTAIRRLQKTPAGAAILRPVS